MLQMEPIKNRYRTNKTAEALKHELMEYQALAYQMGEMEAQLAELCGAIEDFGLACGAPPAQDDRMIYCRAQSYTPSQLISQAQQASAQYEETSQQAAKARGRVLSKILSHTGNSDEYKAIRYAFVDLHDQLASGKPTPEYRVFQES